MCSHDRTTKREYVHKRTNVWFMFTATFVHFRAPCHHCRRCVRVCLYIKRLSSAREVHLLCAAAHQHVQGTSAAFTRKHSVLKHVSAMNSMRYTAQCVSQRIRSVSTAINLARVSPRAPKNSRAHCTHLNRTSSCLLLTKATGLCGRLN